LKSRLLRIRPFSIGAQKLGHPVPLSYFVSLENSGSSQTTQW